MEKPLYIEDKKADNKGLDFEFLRTEGIKYLQELAGTFWTDFNEHDPGVTILEQLCYALTELNYKASFDIQDHLASKKNQQNGLSFFKPHLIFPCNALTINDYRKLIFDSVFNIKNVWILPVDSVENSLIGLYKILIDVEDNIKDEIAKQNIVEKVKTVFTSHRNLCEDIESIKILTHIPIKIYTDVEVDGNREIEYILAEILFLIYQYLSPEIKFYSLEELLNEGYDLNEIYNGPLLKHGFIKSEELFPKPNKILISEIIKLIMQVKGITSVKNLYIKIGDELFENQIILDEHILPELVLDDTEGYTISFFKENLYYTNLDTQLVKRKLNELQSANKRVYRLNEETIDIPEGNPLQIETYHSIQNQFPVNYGIGAYGIPNAPNLQRKAQAKQLKGYLLLFEQILANHLSQLAHVKDLFTINNHLAQTYFGQPLDNVANVEELYKNNPYEFVEDILFRDAKIPLNYQEGLHKLIHEKDNYIDRKSRFLDFLLAIYGESYKQYSLSQFSSFFNEEEFKQYLIQNKIKLFELLPVINRNRAKAFNYLEENLENTNISGLALKISTLLGIGATAMLQNNKAESTYFVDLYTNYKLVLLDEDVPTPLLEKWYQNLAIENVGITLEMITTYFDYVDDEDIKGIDYASLNKEALLESTTILQHNTITISFLKEAIHLKNYRIGKLPNSASYYILFQLKQENTWLQIGNYETLEAATYTVMVLIASLKKLNIQNEKLHIVEHILLRPDVKDEKFGFYLKDEDGNNFLYTKKLYSFEERIRLSKEIQKHLYTYTNYTVERREDGDFEIIFNTADGSLQMLSLKPFISVQEIHEKMEKIYNFLADKQDIIPFEEKIALYTLNSTTKQQIPESFFSYRISLLMPNWAARFANLEFRSTIQETIEKNQPAYIASQSIWLDMSAMKIFEEKYYTWLEAKRVGLDKANIDNLADELTAFLINFYKF